MWPPSVIERDHVDIAFIVGELHGTPDRLNRIPECFQSLVDLSRILKDEPQRRALSQRARAAYLEMFDVGRTLDRLSSLLDVGGSEAGFDA